MAEPGTAAARLTVALTFDHDSLSDGIRRNDSPVKLSHAEFGHRVGVPRILELLEREQIASTWFVPGWTMATYADDTEKLLKGGHELACHGWFHEDFAELSRDAQIAVIDRWVVAAKAASGAMPKGFRAPYWSLGVDTLQLIADTGFTYDSSLMADDYRPYRVRMNDVFSTRGSTFGEESALLEVPVYWTLDDWPQFEPDGARGRDGMSTPSKVLEIWLAELHYAHAHAPGGLLTVTMHPECIGRGHRMAMLEAFIAEAKALDGVVFDRLDRYLEANPIT